jgi:hypothetical protein
LSYHVTRCLCMSRGQTLSPRGSLHSRFWKIHSKLTKCYVHPSNGATAHIGPWPPLLRFRNSSFFYGVGLLAPRPTSNLEDQVSVFMTLGDRMAQLYPRALGSSGTSGCHSPYPLLWAPEGKCYVSTSIFKIVLFSKVCLFIVLYIYIYIYFCIHCGPKEAVGVSDLLYLKEHQ